MVGDHDEEAQCEVQSERERLKKEAQRLEQLRKELDRERAQMAAEMKWERTKLQREKGENNKMESVRRNSIKLDAKRRRDQLEAEREEHRKHSRVQTEKLRVKEAELKSICAVLERQKNDINAERKQMERKQKELQRERDQWLMVQSEQQKKLREHEQFQIRNLMSALAELWTLFDESHHLAKGVRMRAAAKQLDQIRGEWIRVTQAMREFVGSSQETRFNTA